eukprot:148746-Pyramimonas_sp.AAC.1
MFALAAPHVATAATLEGVGVGLGRAVRGIERKQSRGHSKGFKEWVISSLRVGAGALHRWTKSWGKEDPRLAQEFDSCHR